MELEARYKEGIIKFTLIRRKRKTLCIKIDECGKVTIISPLKTSKEYIIKTVEKKAIWIVNKQKYIREISSKLIKRDVVEGGSFMYLGNEYPLNIIFDEKLNNITVTFEEKRILVKTYTMDKEKIKLSLEKWYKEKTLELATKIIIRYEKNFDDKVGNIKAKEQKRRWASCTGKNDILFNWRCSMARIDVLEYIVVHEMCHFEFRNHSKDFWNRVGEIIPDYKEKHNWLRKNGMNLYL